MRRLPPPLAVHPPPCLPAPTPAALPGVRVPAVHPLIKRAISVGDVRRLGSAVHALLVKTALTHDTILSNRLVQLYATLPSPAASRAAFEDLPHRDAYSYNNLLAALSRGPATLPDALHLLDAMPASFRNSISYNTVISAHVRHGRPGEAIRVFSRLARDRCLGPEVAFDCFAVVSVASACAGMGAVRPLRELHGVVVVSGMEVTYIMANAMLQAYSKAGRMEDARMLFNQMSIRGTISWTSMIAGYCRAKRLDEAVQVFDMMPEQDTIAWTALISGHEQNGKEDAALELFEQMLGEGMVPTPVALVSSLGACAKLGLVTRGKEVHGFILRHCIGSHPFNIIIHNALINMYSKCGDMATAMVVFERMPERDLISWNSMMTGFSHNGQGKQSLGMFNRMLEAEVQPNDATFLAVLTACSLVSKALGRNHHLEEPSEFIKGLSSRIGPGTTWWWGALLDADGTKVLSIIELAISVGDVRRLGPAAHAVLVKTALTHHTLLSNRLIMLYATLPSPAASRAAFEDIPHRNAHSYNYLLAALSRGPATLPDALHLLDAMPASSRDAVSYITVISALVRHGRHREALRVFARLAGDRCLGPDVAVDRFAAVSIARACAGMGAVRPLRELHGVVVVSGMEVTVIMANTMLDAYSKAGRMEDARMLFNQMRIKNRVSWSSMIAGYCRAKRLDDAVQVFGRMPEQDTIAWAALISGHEQNGEEDAALELFDQMLSEGMTPTSFALVSSLGACAKLGLVKRGKEVHGFILRHCIGSDPFNIFIHNALIGMYSKCGDTATAMVVFERMPERDLISWDSMVTGFSRNGQGKQSLGMFKRMLEAEVQPTYVTFLAVLTACSHAGLVSDGCRILESMQYHGVEPTADHYASFVDALGRNHQLEEASEFIKGLSSRNGPGTTRSWEALLGACRVHGNIEIAEKVAKTLFQLEPENSDWYVILSNMYAAAGQWDDARRVWALMKEKGLRKDQACSWIEVRTAKHMVVADDMSHCEANEIYEMLDKLLNHMHMHIVVDPHEDQLAPC